MTTARRVVSGCLAGLCLPLVLGGGLGPTQAFADPTVPVVAPRPGAPVSPHPAPFDLTVSPARMALAPDDLGRTQLVSVMNRGQEAMEVQAEKRNFVAKPDGAPDYQQDAPYGAADWLTVRPSSFDLEPGATQVVRVDVQLPARPDGGDHQVSLVFMVPAGRTGGNIKVNRGVGVPIYLTAPGPVVDSVALSGLAAPGFVSGGTVPITATVTNRGTVHHDFRRPSPLTVAAPGRAEPFPDFTVPRDSVRDVATRWDPPLLCVCHPTVTMTSADGGLQSQTVRVVVFPWQWFGAGLGTVLLLLLLVRTSRRRYRADVQKAAAALSARVSAGDV